jgi:membrane protein implicated in regulation of membrane protease activity
MMEMSAFTVFIGIGAVGFLFLLISLLFGEIFEHFDHSLDHDHDHGGPSILSSRVLSVFITAFGGFGALAINQGFGIPAASGVGFASGVFFGGIIYYFAKFLYGQQASTQVTASDLTGRPARVIVAIPAGGVGQVRIHLGEEMVDKVAKVRDGAALGENAIVVIEEIMGELVIVRPQSQPDGTTSGVIA